MLDLLHVHVFWSKDVLSSDQRKTYHSVVPLALFGKNFYLLDGVHHASRFSSTFGKVEYKYRKTPIGT